MSKSKRWPITSLAYINRLLRIPLVPRLLSLGIFCLFTVSANAQTSQIPVAGQDYLVVSDTPSEANEITIYCWLGSASCYQVEYALSNWAKDKELSLRYKPLIKRPHWRLLAKARLVARQLGYEAEFVSLVYQQLHKQGELIDSEEALLKIVEATPMSSSRFVNLYYAAETNQQLKDIQEEAKNWPISGVPTIIIKQRWLLDAQMHKTSRSIINTLDYLYHQEP